MDVRVLCRQVIKTLDPKLPVNSSPDIRALKNQLSEKERKIQHLEVNSCIWTSNGRWWRRGSHVKRIFYQPASACFCHVERLWEEPGPSGQGGEAHHLCLVQHGEQHNMDTQEADFFYLFLQCANDLSVLTGWMGWQGGGFYPPDWYSAPI